MNLRTLFNVAFLGALVYSIFCGYQYMKLREAILSELKGKVAIQKAIGDLNSVKIGISQYPSVGCSEKLQPTWWELVGKHRSEGCFRLTLDLQSESLRTAKMSVDYNSEALVGVRISRVMLCQKVGEVSARDNGIPVKYVNCE